MAESGHRTRERVVGTVEFRGVGGGDARAASVPRLPAAPIHRHAVCERLNRARDIGGGTALLSSVAGSGKTVAVVSWLECIGTRGRTVAWTTLGEQHNDPVLFWDTVAASVGAPTATPDPSPRAAAAALLRWLDATPGEVVIVLDDAHVLHDPITLSALSFFLSRLPKPVTIVVAARFDPPVAWPQLDASGVLVRVGGDSLRFTRDETRELFEGERVRVSESDVDEIVGTTRGWAAMVRFVLLLFAETGTRPAALDSLTASRRPVAADRIVDELLASMSPRTRRFLAATAVPDDFTTDLAAALAGPRAEHTLARLLATNFPISRTGSGRSEVYRYHPMMRAYLLAELTRTMGHERRAALDAQVGRWFERERQPDRALGHLVASGDHGEIARCVAESGPRAVWSGSGTAWLRALDDAPADIGGDPFVHLLRAMHAVRHREFGGARAFVDIANAAVGSDLCPPHVFARLRVAVTRDVEGALGILDAGDVPPTDRPDVECYVALVEARTDPAAAAPLLHRALALAEHVRIPELELAARALLAADAGAHGSLTVMAGRAEAALAFAAGAGLRQSVDAARSGALLALQRYLTAEVPVRGADPAADPVAYALAELDGLADSDDRAVAAQTIARAARRSAEGPPVPVAGPMLALATTWMLLELHEPEHARSVVRAAHDLYGDVAECEIGRAAIDVACGHAGDARVRLDSVLTRTDPSPSRVDALVLRAVVRAEAGDRVGSDADIEAALLAAEPERLVRPFLAVRGAMALLDAGAGRFGCLDEFAETIRHRPDAVHARSAVILTAAETRVLRQLPSPCTAGEIAAVLGVSVNTVKTHLRGIYGKLGASTRTEAVGAARAIGLL